MNEENLRLFWAFIRERHTIWYLRTIEKAPPPWTDDPVLASTFFTNVYRELDPGTVFAVNRLRMSRAAGCSMAELVFNAVAYRLAFNEHAMQALGWLPVGERWVNGAAALRAQLHGIEKPFTSAYVVSNYGRKGSKVDVIMDVLGDMAQALAGPDWKALLDSQASHTREEWLAYLQGNLFGAGPFVSFQATVDLCYPEVSALFYDNDGYALAGPGARKGLQLVFRHKEGSQYERNLQIARLCDMQHEGLGDGMLGMWDGEDAHYINRANMQNCLCEFGKYHRALAGGKVRRKFTPDDSHYRDRLARGHMRQMDLEDSI